MTQFKILLIIFLASLGFIGYLVYNTIPEVNNNVDVEQIVRTECVSTFRDGGGPYYKPNSPFRENIAPAAHSGEELSVSGLILENDCKTPVKNAVLDIWQANENGNYEDAWYRGRVTTNNNGEYLFKTVVPKGYGEGTGYRPPHIHFKVFKDNLEVVTSQMFFPEVRGHEGFNDAYIMSIQTSTENGTKIHKGYHDIILP